MINKSDIKPGVILYDKNDHTAHEVLDISEHKTAFYVSVQDTSIHNRLHGYHEYTLTDIRRFFKLKP